MEKETKGDMSGGKGTLWMVVIFLLVVGGGFLAVNWDKIQERGRRFIETGSPLSLLQEKDSVEREGTTQDGVYRKKISEGLLKENGAFKGKGPQGAGVPQDGDLYGSLQKEVALFCDYLDHQAYVESYRLEGGVYDTLLRAITLLSRNPPVISGETRDVYILMKNTAHFYRELKGKRIALAKAVLNEEKEAMEPLFELLYAWIMAGVQERNPEIRTSLKDLYIYASFSRNPRREGLPGPPGFPDANPRQVLFHSDSRRGRQERTESIRNRHPPPGGPPRGRHLQPEGPGIS